MCVCDVYANVHGTEQGDRVDPLEQELQAMVSHQMKVLGTEFGSSGKAASAINCSAASQPLHEITCLLKSSSLSSVILNKVP